MYRKINNFKARPSISARIGFFWGFFTHVAIFGVLSSLILYGIILGEKKELEIPDLKGYDRCKCKCSRESRDGRR
jgi:hypothetical protein